MIGVAQGTKKQCCHENKLFHDGKDSAKQTKNQKISTNYRLSDSFFFFFLRNVLNVHNYSVSLHTKDSGVVPLSLLQMSYAMIPYRQGLLNAMGPFSSFWQTISISS